MSDSLIHPPTHSFPSLFPPLPPSPCRVDMESAEFSSHLEPFFHSQTAHLVHEFISYARSPFNMAAYDQRVQYDWPADSLRDTWDPEATVNHRQLHHPLGKRTIIEHCIVLLCSVLRVRVCCDLNNTFKSRNEDIYYVCIMRSI